MASMTQLDSTYDSSADAQWLKDRLARQERGIAILRDVLKAEATRREHDIRERDRVIHDLQGHIAERDHSIHDLQKQLGEQDHRIRELEVELHQRQLQEQIGERDRHILELQAEIEAMRVSAEVHAKVTDRDQLVWELQRQMTDRDRHIHALQAEIQTIHLSKLWPLLRLSGLLRQMLDKFGLVNRPRST